MSQPAKCPECGAPLPANSPEGLCRACLFKRGLESNTVGYTQEPSTPWTPPAIEELASRFPELELHRLIGRGGMGAVYQARQKTLDRTVALKILPPAMASDPAFAERFAREAQAMAKLNHPHIVTIYEFGERAGQYYFLMEYVDGVNLRGLLDSGHVSPKEALAIVPQICDALQYAHDQKIVHRDIKPENILLNKQGQVKIADFGLAKLIGKAALTAEKVMGTPQYMAPEQKDRPDEVDHRADIYSLGVVFYQMLTGELPKGAFEPPSRKVQIDVRLDEIVMRALEAEPNRRYQQASEVKTQIETIVGEGTQTTHRRQSVSALRGGVLVFAAIAVLSVVAGAILSISDITPVGINGFEVIFIGIELGLLAGAAFAVVRALGRRTQEAIPNFRNGTVSRRGIWPSLSIAAFALLCGIAVFFAFQPGYKASGLLRIGDRQARQQLRPDMPVATTRPVAEATEASAIAPSKPLPPLPAPQDLPGELLFHGRYQHRSRGVEIAEPSELWVNRTPDGSIAAMSKFPAMQTVELVSGDSQNRPVSYRIRRTGRAPEYGIDLQFAPGQATLSRRSIRQDVDQSLAVPADASFDPNSRPDSYLAANVLLRQFALQKVGEAREIHVFDWDNTGEKLVDYTIRVEFTGLEKVQVPAGTFEARHLTLTQTSSADTWFKKRQGHKTDFWLLDNGVILRILRHREPYEMLLLDYDLPTRLPGLLPPSAAAASDAPPRPNAP